MRLGLREIVNSFKSIQVQLFYASLPHFFTRGLANDRHFARVFAMSRKNVGILEKMGAIKEKIIHIPAGVDAFDMEKPRSNGMLAERYGLKPGSFNVLYFGSPASIRGIDTDNQGYSPAKIQDTWHPAPDTLETQENELTEDERQAYNLIKQLNLEGNVR